MTRHKIQVLRDAGHSQREVAQLTGVGERSVRRLEGEPPVEGRDEVTDTALRRCSRIGRPSKVEGFRKWVESLLEREPEVPTLEALCRAREDGFEGGKSAFYAMVAELRPPPKPKPMVRFEGVAGEFTQHDFGQVWVTFVDGRRTKVQFFASRVTYSRNARNAAHGLGQCRRRRTIGRLSSTLAEVDSTFVEHGDATPGTGYSRMGPGTGMRTSSWKG